MESNNNSLRQVLNSIASIHHELAKDQTQMPDSAIFVQLKNLAAQLYLESDIELLSLAHEEMQTQEEAAVNTPLGATNLFSQVDVPVEVVPTFIPEVESVVVEPVVHSVVESVLEPVVEPVVETALEPVVETAPGSVLEPIVESVVEPVAELHTEPFVEPEVEPMVVKPMFAEEPVVQQETLIEVEPAVEIAPEVIPTPVIEQHPETVVPVQESIEVAPVGASHTIESVIGQMPLSRRFEFSNILFGGDMQKMGMFIQQMIDAPNAAVRMDVYDQWYEEKQWRRRDESASDMLRMLKRIFTA